MALTDLTRISTSGIATGSSLSGAILHSDVHFRGNQVGVNSAIFDSSERELNFKDNVKLTFGDATNGDLRLYHQAPDNYILSNSGTTYIRHLPNGGDIKINATNIHLTNHSNNQTLLKTTTNGPVQLYHAGNPKFQTTSTGAVVTGILTASGFSGPLSNPSGISTFYDLRVTNNLTVEGTTTTLDTNLIGVDRIEVGADSDTIVGVAITQSGTADIFNLYDGSTEVFSVADGGASKFSGNVTIDAGANTTLDVVADSAGVAMVRTTGAHGDQTTAAFELRQSTSSQQGGGISYNGDGSPGFVSGETADNTTFYRILNGTRSEVFSYPYNSDTVTFNGTVVAPAFQGNLNGTVNTAAQPNITSLGTLTSLTVSGAGSPISFTHTGGNCVTFNRNSKQLAINANYAGSDQYSNIVMTSGMDIRWTLGGVDRINFKSAGHIEPVTDSQINLGANLKRFANVYSDNLFAGGDVGIGNDSPNCKLAIKDTAEHTAYNSVTPNVTDAMLQLYNNPPNETANDHATIQFGVNGGSHNRVNTISAVAESAGNRKLAFTFCTDEAGSRTEKMRISGDGQVSIGGNSTVNTKLHVENSSGDAHIRLRGSVNYGVLFNRHSDGALTGFVGSGGAVNLGGSNLGISASLSGGDIVFQTGGTASINERARILSNGNIGIGTDTAPHKLSVKGTISMISGASGTQIVNLSQDGSNNGYVMVNDSSGTTRARLDSSGVSYVRGGNFGVGTDSPNSIIQATGSNSSTGYYFKNTHTTSGFGMRVEGGGTTADRYSLAVFNAAGVERFRVNANGRVGINSATPEFEFDVLPPIDVLNNTLCVKGRGSGYAQLRLEGEGGASENYLTSTTVPLSIYVGSGGQKAKFDTGGNFLIGAGGADHFLHIKQNAETTYAKIESTHSSSTYTGINLRTPSLNFQIWNQGPGASSAGYGGANSVNFWQAASTGPYAFYHGNTERLRIDTSGRIGVNNNDPSGRTGSIDISSNDGTSGKSFTDQRAASMLTLRNPSTTQHSFTQMAFINGGGTQAATLLRHRYGSSHGPLQNYVGDLCLFRRTGGAGSGANDFRESTRWCGDNAEARQIWWAYGDTDTSNTSRLGWHHLSAQRDHPGTDAYSFFRLETGAASYARGGMGKYTVVWTTGHASGYGLQIGHFGYYMPHGSSTIVVNEHIIHRERWSNGSYYGWNDAPNMRIINNTASGGTNAAISFRCGGRRYSGGYDMDVRVGIFIELYAPESANGDRTPRLYVAGNSDSNLSGGGFGNPVTHAYVSFQSTNPLSSGQPTNTINTGLPTSNPANAGEFYRDGTDLRVSTG